jgi:hypothetical protein
MNRLYDQKSFAFSHHNINKLRVKLATGRDASLVRLPPSEAALRQHILRASFQTKVWHVSCLAKLYEWTFLHDSDPWQEHKSVHARFCSAQTQDFLHCMNTLDHEEILLTCFLQSRLDAKNP